MPDPSNIASNLRKRGGSRPSRKARARRPKYGIPEGEKFIKIGTLPPGLAKKRAGVRSARSFAPGQVRRRSLATPTRPTKTAPLAPKPRPTKVNPNPGSSVARSVTTTVRPSKSASPRNQVVPPARATGGMNRGRRTFPPPPGQAKKLAGARSARAFTRKRRT